jgi:hypothetical protein
MAGEKMTSLQLRVLVIAILASFVAFLDGAVINVALPAIDKELGGGLPLQQVLSRTSSGVSASSTSV